MHRLVRTGAALAGVLMMGAAGLLCSCSRQPASQRNDDIRASRNITTDCLYVASSFRKPVRSATFVPDDSLYDFGAIGYKRPVSHRFTFTNKGEDAVVIDTVKAHCGCTTSTFTHEPVKPGGRGSVTVTYDPTDHEGWFRKTATLVLNGGESYAEVRVTGTVVR